MNAVTLAKDFDPDILRVLYPVSAQRYQMSARVTITCQIEPTLTLLCREPGRIDNEQGTPPENAQGIYAALVFASYQAASTIRLAPRAKDGSDVTGTGPISLHDDGATAEVLACRRIGLTRNADAPLRFVVPDSPYLSKPAVDPVATPR